MSPSLQNVNFFIKKHIFCFEGYLGMEHKYSYRSFLKEVTRRFNYRLSVIILKVIARKGENFGEKLHKIMCRSFSN